MDDDKLYAQYLYEVSLFEKYGSKNVITFDEWKWIKSSMDNTQLTTPPELPATTSTDDCYEHMFDDCISLTTVPELPARTVDESYLKLCRELLGHLPEDKETLI